MRRRSGRQRGSGAHFVGALSTINMRKTVVDTEALSASGELKSTNPFSTLGGLGQAQSLLFTAFS